MIGSPLARWLLFTLLLSIPAGAADYTFTIIADSRPGSGLTFDRPGLHSVVINSKGEVAFDAFRQNAGGNTGGQVLLAGSGGALRTLVDVGQQVSLGTLLSMNSDGTALFVGRTGFFLTWNLFTTSGGAITPVPSDPGDFPSIIAGDINDDGVVAYSTNGEIRIVKNGVSRLANPSSPRDLSFGQLNRAGAVAYTTKVNGVLGIYEDSNGSIREVGISSSNTFSTLAGRPSLNDLGTVVISGTVGPPIEGSSSVLQFDRSGMTVLARGALAYIGPEINNSGTVIFGTVTVGTIPGTFAVGGIYVGSESESGKIIAVGDTLFGSRVTSLSGFGGVSGRYSNDRGQVAFLYRLANGTDGVAVATPATAAIPSLQQGSVVNGASYLPGIVSGSWAQVKGTDLSATTRTWGGSDFTSSNTLPTALDGVEVKVNGLPAAVYFVSPTQVSFQVPGSVSGPATVQIVRNGVASNTAAGNSVTTAPGLFVYSAGTKTYPAAVFANTATVIGDPGISGGIVRKARSGDRVALYATGLAPSPAGVVPNGTNFGGVTATIGSTAATVEFAGLVAVGQFQINIVVPSLPVGEYPLVIRYNGEVSQPGVLFPVGP